MNQDITKQQKVSKQQRLAQSPIWNLFLLTIGSFLFALGAQGVAAHQGFLTGGLFGTGMLIWYGSGWLSPAIWYGIMNIPLFIVSWFHIGRSFLLYSLYATVATSIFSELITYQAPIENSFYAAVAAGVLCGAGAGMNLRTMGSGGGLDVIGVILNRKWNIGVGKFSFSFNAILFVCAAWTISLDMVIVSIIQVFITSSIMEYVLRLFNQRKMVYVVTDHGEEISEAIIAEGFGGATVLKGKGAYSGDNREIILTVTNNIVLRQLENLVFDIDSHALFIVENTFYVSGARYPRKSVI